MGQIYDTWDKKIDIYGSKNNLLLVYLQILIQNKIKFLILKWDELKLIFTVLLLLLL